MKDLYQTINEKMLEDHSDLAKVFDILLHENFSIYVVFKVKGSERLRLEKYKYDIVNNVIKVYNFIE